MNSFFNLLGKGTVADKQTKTSAGDISPLVQNDRFCQKRAEKNLKHKNKRRSKRSPGTISGVIDNNDNDNGKLGVANACHLEGHEKNERRSKRSKWSKDCTAKDDGRSSSSNNNNNNTMNNEDNIQISNNNENNDTMNTVSNSRVCTASAIRTLCSRRRQTHQGAAQISSMSREDWFETCYGKDWKLTAEDPSIDKINDVLAPFDLELVDCKESLQKDVSKVFKQNQGQFLLIVKWAAQSNNDSRGNTVPPIKDHHTLAFVSEPVDDGHNNKVYRIVIDSTHGRKAMMLEPQDYQSKEASEGFINTFLTEEGRTLKTRVERSYFLVSITSRITSLSEWLKYSNSCDTC